MTRLLNELEMDKKEIDEIVLVGGTTRIPLIKQQVVSLFSVYYLCIMFFLIFMYYYVYFIIYCLL